MKNRIISCLMFAILAAAIPLAALKTVQVPSFSPPLVPIATEARQPAAIREPQTELDAPELLPPSEEDKREVASLQSVAIPEPKSFLVLNEDTGKIMTVPVRDYVRGALAAELPPTFHPEALKAQAVAAHTYALYLTRLRQETPVPSLKGAQLSADPENWKSYTTEKVFRQRYGELADAYWKAICEAADEVCGYLLTYEDEPIVAAYHSMSTGTTEDASNVWSGGAPYLVPVESRGDPLAPDYETTVSFSQKKMREILDAACPDTVLDADPSDWLTIGERSESGYVMEVWVGASDKLAGKQLRTLLDLRSSDFDIEFDGESFVFTVRGYGHGVGLSQYGADYLARQGMNFEEILAHYYSGTILATSIPE